MRNMAMVACLSERTDCPFNRPTVAFDSRYLDCNMSADILCSSLRRLKMKKMLGKDGVSPT